MGGEHRFWSAIRGWVSPGFDTDGRDVICLSFAGSRFPLKAIRRLAWEKETVAGGGRRLPGVQGRESDADSDSATGRDQVDGSRLGRDRQRGVKEEEARGPRSGLAPRGPSAENGGTQGQGVSRQWRGWHLRRAAVDMAGRRGARDLLGPRVPGRGVAEPRGGLRLWPRNRAAPDTLQPRFLAWQAASPGISLSP